MFSLSSISGSTFLVDYDQVKRGNLGRTPEFVTLDLHFDYPFQIGTSQMRFFVDVFNVFDNQSATNYADAVEVTSGVLNPNFLAPVSYQAPRSWRLGARWDF